MDLNRIPKDVQDVEAFHSSTTFEQRKELLGIWKSKGGKEREYSSLLDWGHDDIRDFSIALEDGSMTAWVSSIGEKITYEQAKAYLLSIGTEQKKPAKPKLKFTDYRKYSDGVEISRDGMVKLDDSWIDWLTENQLAEQIAELRKDVNRLVNIQKRVKRFRRY